MKTYCKPFVRGASWRSQNFGDNLTIYGPHSGNDEAVPVGTPVHAAGDGVIEFAGEFDDTYADNLLWLVRMGGNVLVLNCGDVDPSFVYAHLHSFTVRPGDTVTKGQVIALSGNTGTATTGAHTHVECIPPGYNLNSYLLGRVNPDLFLTEWPEDISTESDDDMWTDKEKETHFSVLDNVNEKTAALPDALYWDNLIKAVARIDTASAETIVQSIPDNLVQQVLDGLAERLAKK